MIRLIRHIFNYSGMKTISVADDVYEHLRLSADLGEDASSVLRRLLRIRGDELSRPSIVSDPSQPLREPVSKLVQDPELLAQRSAIARFLGILERLHRQHPDTFSRVERVRGRKRLYFSKDERTLANSGVSVNPQRIPGTDYWVATNNDTGKKRDILTQVLRTLTYADHEIRAIIGLLV